MASLDEGVRRALLAHNFEVLGLFGRGGFGHVVHARCLNSDEHVAIKTLCKAEARRLGMASRVVSEVALHSGLVHPHIVRLLDFFEDAAHVYLVLEACRGGDIYRLLKSRGCLDVGAAIHFGRQLFASLSYLHALGVLHRDLKLSNLLLDGVEGTQGAWYAPLALRLCDFGLAVSVAGEGEHRTLCGTPAYIAPEIATASQAHSPAADVYSAGCLLYSMLVGSPPLVPAPGAGTEYATALAGDFEEQLARLDARAAGLIRWTMAAAPSERPTAADVLNHAFFAEWAAPVAVEAAQGSPLDLPSFVCPRVRTPVLQEEEEEAAGGSRAPSGQGATPYDPRAYAGETEGSTRLPTFVLTPFSTPPRPVPALPPILAVELASVGDMTVAGDAMRLGDVSSASMGVGYASREATLAFTPLRAAAAVVTPPSRTRPALPPSLPRAAPSLFEVDMTYPRVRTPSPISSEEEEGAGGRGEGQPAPVAAPARTPARSVQSARSAAAALPTPVRAPLPPPEHSWASPSRSAFSVPSSIAAGSEREGGLDLSVRSRGGVASPRSVQPPPVPVVPAPLDVAEALFAAHDGTLRAWARAAEATTRGREASAEASRAAVAAAVASFRSGADAGGSDVLGAYAGMRVGRSVAHSVLSGCGTPLRLGTGSHTSVGASTYGGSSYPSASASASAPLSRAGTLAPAAGRALAINGGPLPPPAPVVRRERPAFRSLRPLHTDRLHGPVSGRCDDACGTLVSLARDGVTVNVRAGPLRATFKGDLAAVAADGEAPSRIPVAELRPPFRRLHRAAAAVLGALRARTPRVAILTADCSAVLMEDGPRPTFELSAAVAGGRGVWRLRYGLAQGRLVVTEPDGGAYGAYVRPQAYAAGVGEGEGCPAGLVVVPPSSLPPHILALYGLAMRALGACMRLQGGGEGEGEDHSLTSYFTSVSRRSEGGWAGGPLLFPIVQERHGACWLDGALTHALLRAGGGGQPSSAFKAIQRAPRELGPVR